MIILWRFILNQSNQKFNSNDIFWIDRKNKTLNIRLLTKILSFYWGINNDQSKKTLITKNLDCFKKNNRFLKVVLTDGNDLNKTVYLSRRVEKAIFNRDRL